MFLERCYNELERKAQKIDHLAIRATGATNSTLDILNA